MLINDHLKHHWLLNIITNGLIYVASLGGLNQFTAADAQIKNARLAVAIQQDEVAWLSAHIRKCLSKPLQDGDGVPEKKSDGAPAKKAGDREPDSVH